MDDNLFLAISFLNTKTFFNYTTIEPEGFEDTINFLIESGIEIEDVEAEYQTMTQAEKVVIVSFAGNKTEVKNLLLSLGMTKEFVGQQLKNQMLLFRCMIKYDDCYIYHILDIEIIKVRGHKKTEEELTFELNQALKQEDYHLAAKLRDKIKKKSGINKK